MRTHPRGFTTVELVVAIGILLILVGILVVGLSHVGNTAKGRNTQVTLRNLEGMFAEAGLAGGLQPLDHWWWDDDPYFFDPADRDIVDFWQVPWRNPFAPGGDPLPLLAPDVSQVDSVGRVGSDAVRNTGGVFTALIRVPSNRSAIEQLPPEQNLVAMEAWRPDVDYHRGHRVYAVVDGDFGIGNYPAGPRYFVCVESHTSSPGGPPPQLWQEAESAILDGWRNPIIFVPASGLVVVIAGQPRVVTSPDGRPFFASAGPSGDFQNGDDNLYSFEN